MLSMNQLERRTNVRRLLKRCRGVRRVRLGVDELLEHLVGAHLAGVRNARKRVEIG